MVVNLISRPSQPRSFANQTGPIRSAVLWGFKSGICNMSFIVPGQVVLSGLGLMRQVLCTTTGWRVSGWRAS